VPPHRRRPAPTSGQSPPIRRPKVAGLRNRPDTPRDQEQVPEEQLAEEHLAEEQPERESMSGVLDGVIGAEPDDPAEPEPEPRPKAEPKPKAKPQPRPQPSPAGSRPAGKRRATGTARPANLEAAEAGADAGIRRPARHAKVTDPKPERTIASRQVSVAVVLAVVAVILAGLAIFFRGKATDLTSADSNTALTDSASTSQVISQLSNAIKTTFSYNYTDLDSTAKAVKATLTGNALCEYNLLFGEVKQFAPEQKIILATTVREIALVRLDGDRAEALVYIDQSSTRVDTKKSVAAGGQFVVMAHRDGDQWKINEFDMFGQPLPNGKPAPKC
jgi:Mce-associated membrane protein